jgi:hypothetical protein
MPRAHLHLGQALVWAGEWDEALVQLHVAQALVDEGERWLRVQAHAVLANLLAGRGDWDASDTEMRASEELVAAGVGSAESAVALLVTAGGRARARNDARGVVAALESLPSVGERPVPGTGSLEGDCRVYAESVAAMLGAPAARAGIARVAAAAVRNPQLAHALHDRVLAPRRVAVGEIVRRAVARDELPASTDIDVFIDALIGPMYHRALVGGGPIDADFAQRLVGVVLRGAMSRQFA